MLLMVSAFIFLHTYFAKNEGLKSGSGCIFGDCKDGYGGYLWPSGDSYTGQWKAAKQDGIGLMRWQDGRTYVGQWQDGKISKQGAMYSSNAQIRRGQWLNGDFLGRQKINFDKLKIDSLWGEKQLAQMQADRPKMQAHSAVAEKLKYWFVAKLAGEKVGEKISWQAEEDSDFQIPPNVTAVHRWPSATHAPAIWLSPDLESEELWASLVFELYNMENADGFEQINADVMRGTCDEASYVRRFAELEHVAVLKTQQFYSEYWLPACQNQKMKSQAQIWFAYADKDFATWLSGYTDKNSYPWQPYTLYFQQILSNTTKKY
jgi:hypothetical protein